MRTKGKAKPKPEEHADQDDETTENKVLLILFHHYLLPEIFGLENYISSNEPCLQKLKKNLIRFKIH
jgi:hypothetical protein